MKYYFAGSEIESWRTLLVEQQVPTVALSYIGLKRRLRKAADNWKITDNYPQSQSIFLDSGAYTLNRADDKYDFEQAINLAHNYMEYVGRNIDSVDLVSEFDAQILGYDVIKEMRENFYNGLAPEKFMPIWHPEYGTGELESLCSEYEVVGVTQLEIHDTSLASTFNQVINRYNVRLHGVAITSKEMLRQVAWDSVSSMSWLSPSVYGDTIIWTGRELKRYPKDYKSQGRKKHRTWLEENGFDSTKIENDDSTELLKLSLWSWQQFVSKLDRGVTSQRLPRNTDFTDLDLETVAMQGVEDRNEQLLPAVIEKRETVLLPVMGIRKITGNDDEGTTETPFVFKRSESMRVCNTCFLKAKCPGFKPDANCLYNIPIEVKTRDQLRAVQDALIEMQTQRVLFMQMAEDMEGGYADPNLSSEMDRLQKMITARETRDKDTFNLSISATQDSNRPGFLENLLGKSATERIRQLPAPIDADQYIKEQEIFEADIIE